MDICHRIGGPADGYLLVAFFATWCVGKLVAATCHEMIAQNKILYRKALFLKF